MLASHIFLLKHGYLRSQLMQVFFSTQVFEAVDAVPVQPEQPELQPTAKRLLWRGNETTIPQTKPCLRHKFSTIIAVDFEKKQSLPFFAIRNDGVAWLDFI